MIDLPSLYPEIKYIAAYAKKSNFTGEKLYSDSTHAWMRKAPAMALETVIGQLREKGIGIIVFDAYRPYSVTKKMWELIHDERYVANPAKGSGHNRGLAIDLGLIDLKTGIVIDMGTGFDNFTDSAHHSFHQFSDSVLSYRQLLKTLMTNAGFKGLDTEWWHYSWPNDKAYAILDIPGEKIPAIR